MTDQNEFLQDDETSNPFVNFLPDDLEKLDAMLEFWLDDDGVLDKTRAEAVAHYAQRHTWVQRLEPVLEFLNEHYWTHKTP